MEGRNMCYRRPNYSGTASASSANWGNFISLGRYGNVHSTGTNLLYADGHCDWLREVQCSAGVFMLTPDDRNNSYNHRIDW